MSFFTVTINFPDKQRTKILVPCGSSCKSIEDLANEGTCRYKRYKRRLERFDQNTGSNFLSSTGSIPKENQIFPNTPKASIEAGTIKRENESDSNNSQKSSDSNSNSSILSINLNTIYISELKTATGACLDFFDEISVVLVNGAEIFAILRHFDDTICAPLEQAQISMVRSDKDLLNSPLICNQKGRPHANTISAAQSLPRPLRKKHFSSHSDDINDEDVTITSDEYLKNYIDPQRVKRLNKETQRARRFSKASSLASSGNSPPHVSFDNHVYSQTFTRTPNGYFQRNAPNRLNLSSIHMNQKPMPFVAGGNAGDLIQANYVHYSENKTPPYFSPSQLVKTHQYKLKNTGQLNQVSQAYASPKVGKPPKKSCMNISKSNENFLERQTFHAADNYDQMRRKYPTGSSKSSYPSSLSSYEQDDGRYFHDSDRISESGISSNMTPNESDFESNSNRRHDQRSYTVSTSKSYGDQLNVVGRSSQMYGLSPKLDESIKMVKMSTDRLNQTRDLVRRKLKENEKARTKVFNDKVIDIYKLTNISRQQEELDNIKANPKYYLKNRNKNKQDHRPLPNLPGLRQSQEPSGYCSVADIDLLNQNEIYVLPKVSQVATIKNAYQQKQPCVGQSVPISSSNNHLRTHPF